MIDLRKKTLFLLDMDGTIYLGDRLFDGTLDFLRRVRERFPEKNVWCFTGFTYEELLTEGNHPRCEVTDELLSLLDVLVDGRFVAELKNIGLRFRGSSNQRLIDLNATRRSGKIILLPDRKRGI